MAGLLLIITGLVLVVLPGPLTIPPILLGVWLWSLEFEFARHWLAPLKRRGSQAMDAAREKPVHTTVITVLGLVGAGLLIWAAAALRPAPPGRPGGGAGLTAGPWTR